MAVIATPTNNIHGTRPERTVTGVNPLRARDRVRGLLRRELLTPADLVAPVLVQPDRRDPADYRHLPGAVAVSDLAAHARYLRDVGVRAVKLFAYVENKTPSRPPSGPPLRRLSRGRSSAATSGSRW
jgi:porphobilinogen synthase